MSLAINYHMHEIDDATRLQMLLDELVGHITEQFPSQITSIVLFGSATTGEWVRGKSDIDCIVIIKDREKRKEVEGALYSTLLELDAKYDLKLSETCSIYRDEDNQILGAITKAEKFAMFGRPFYVLSEDQIDIKNAKMKPDDLKVYIGTHVIASVNLFFHRIRSTGRVLYGRDLTKEFPTSIPKIEKLKASLNALLLLMMSALVLPFDPSYSFQRAVKANFWACDNALFALERPLSDSQNEVSEIERMFSEHTRGKNMMYVDVEHLRTSLKYKRMKKTYHITRKFVLKYVVKSAIVIAALYLITARRMFSAHDHTA